MYPSVVVHEIILYNVKVEELVEKKDREERERKAESRREASLRDIRLQVGPMTLV